MRYRPNNPSFSSTSCRDWRFTRVWYNPKVDHNSLLKCYQNHRCKNPPPAYRPNCKDHPRPSDAQYTKPKPCYTSTELYRACPRHMLEDKHKTLKILTGTSFSFSCARRLSVCRLRSTPAHQLGGWGLTLPARRAHHHPARSIPHSYRAILRGPCSVPRRW